MTTRKKIILAVANGCKSARQIAKHLNIAPSTVNNYFYETNSFFGQRFINGRLLQWAPGKANTLQLGPRAAVIRGRDGRVRGVGMVADMDDLEGSYRRLSL